MVCIAIVARRSRSCAKSTERCGDFAEFKAFVLVLVDIALDSAKSPHLSAYFAEDLDVLQCVTQTIFQHQAFGYELFTLVQFKAVMRKNNY